MRLHVQTVFSSPLPGLGLRSAPGCIRSTNWIASSRLDILPALCEPSASRGRTWPGQSPAGKNVQGLCAWNSFSLGLQWAVPVTVAALFACGMN
jgi:hypothetical protein